ncbi:MAG: hypothetical protein ACI9TY_001237 [Alphaproteobacteria bacterium]|jgi:hypothetical protein
MKNENQQEELKEKPQFWLKLVLLLGFLLQFVIAYFLFTVLTALPAIVVLNPNLNILISLLLSLMLATPLGFLLANFISHHLPFMRHEIQKIGDYKGTRKILFKLLISSLAFSLLVIVICHFAFS